MGRLSSINGAPPDMGVWEWERIVHLGSLKEVLGVRGWSAVRWSRG